MTGYIGRDEKGRYVDDDKALANAGIEQGEAMLDLIDIMEAGGLSYTGNLMPIRERVERTIAQLHQVNVRKESEADIESAKEDMDTWLDGG